MKLGGSQINSADFKRTSFPTSFFILFVPHGRVDVVTLVTKVRLMICCLETPYNLKGDPMGFSITNLFNILVRN